MTQEEKQKSIRVAAAVILDQQGRVLLTKRHDHVHQGGLWEFPGGKIEAGETVQTALERELKEELGIGLLTHRPLIQVEHHYKDRSVVLDMHLVSTWTSEPKGQEGQPLVWVHREQLDEYEMPEADRPIIAAINLPDTYVITPPEADDARTWLNNLEEVLSCGIKLIQFRVFGLSPGDKKRLAEEALALCHKWGARMLINADMEMHEAIGADGVHLSGRQLHAIGVRKVSEGLVGVSCHNDEDLRKAQQIGANFAVLSPVKPTQSHPDATPLGWENFLTSVKQVTLPVYALGGLGPEDMPTAWDYGAQGVSGIRGFWSV